MRRLLVLAATVAALLLGASRALACGTSAGYSYAGVAAPAKAFGISASVTPMGGFDVMAGHVAGWQLPERWSFIDEVPKTSVGKFDKKVLRARHADGALEVEQLT